MPTTLLNTENTSMERIILDTADENQGQQSSTSGYYQINPNWPHSAINLSNGKNTLQSSLHVLKSVKIDSQPGSVNKAPLDSYMGLMETDLPNMAEEEEAVAEANGGVEK